MFEILLSLFWGMQPEVELLDHMVILYLSFRGITTLFFIAIEPFYISPNSIQGFQFFRILANTYFFVVVCLFFSNSHYNGYEMVSHCGLIHITLMIRDVEPLFMCLKAICMSSLEKCLNPSPIFKSGCLYFCCPIVRVEAIPAFFVAATFAISEPL